MGIEMSVSQGMELQAKGDHVGALKLLGKIQIGDSGYAEAVKAVAASAVAVQDWALASLAAQQSIELNGENIEDYLILGQAFRTQKKFKQGADALDNLFKFVGDDTKLGPKPFMLLALCDSYMGKAARSERVLRRCMELYPDSAAGTRLAEHLYNLGRLDEAKEIANQVLATRPKDRRANAVRNLLGHKANVADEERSLATWPSNASRFGDARKIIKNSLLKGYPECPPFIFPQTRFVTLGSCFAVNLASRLGAKGYKVFSEMIGEDINSTFANRYFLDWIENGPTSDPTQQMQDAYGSELRDRYLSAMKSCNVMVFTLGLAAAFFHPGTANFAFVNNTHLDKRFMMKRYEMRTTTVAENVENLRAIVETARRLAGDPTIVLTVSPVPMAATTEMESAVIADCLSKSTLRLACHEVCTTDRRLQYWPSFEIVRWLGPHFGHMHPPVYGAVDNKSRHVSTWIVDTIVDLFHEAYSDDAQDQIDGAMAQ